ncbi:Sensor histidine kinase YpdA [Blautia producta]|uniref:histidine kinase n=1 Tax=Blautia producta TaxID=33035 RepID=A0A4P6LUU5_9FIRM|nr:sensor histidine kinase [Blautia producta]QBE95796.1 Sensor histidine kinase YpdA [Blautia producta]
MTEKGKGKLKITGIRKKMLLVFAVLITITGAGISVFSAAVFKQGYGKISKVYLQDITQQTTNNLENMIQTIEDINIQILSSSVIQEQLEIVNGQEMELYSIRNISKIVERELETNALFSSDVVSLSVFSKSGLEFSVKKITGRGTDLAFSEREIYAANGTTLWGLVGPDDDICIAKAILDLTTMRPIGYINIVYEREYFGDIVRDNSTEYSGACYVVDRDGVITVTNHERYLGDKFPVEIEKLRESETWRYDILNGTNSFYYVGNEMPNGWTLVEAVSVKEFYKNTYRVIGLTGIFLLGILILSFISVSMATKHIAKPTQDLLESMKLFGMGNLSHRVEVKTTDEIGQIGSEYNRMAENIETLIEKVYKMEITQKQAEIDFLCMQINPHFLYNTLDTISWMAIMQGNLDISEMTISLADLLRAMIQKDRFVTVEDEMKTVKDYLLIQGQRFGDKISVIYDIDEQAYPCRIPNFILQPLIENAIIHGLEPKLEKGTLRVQIKLENEAVAFCIADNGVGMSREEIQALYEKCEMNDTNQNIGLKNVYRRLILCYGETSRLHIESEKHRGTKIKFILPMTIIGQQEEEN